MRTFPLPTFGLTKTMNTFIKKTGATLALGTCLFATSCIGPNNAYNAVLGWNSRLADSKWVNELVYLGMNIIPVYPLILTGDCLIFNSVEFWSGNNWIKKPEAFKPQETPGPDKK